MKLAEALLERKSLMDKVGTLETRLVQNVMVQEGDNPMEPVDALLLELEATVAQLENIIKRINATNNVARLPNGATVSEAIVHRDMLKMRRDAIEQVAERAAMRQDRYTRGEVKFVITVDVRQIRSNVDELSKAWRELDAQIQAVNWNTDLME